MFVVRVAFFLICLVGSTLSRETDFSYQGNDLEFSSGIDAAQEKQSSYLEPSSSSTSSQGYLYYYNPTPDNPVSKSSSIYAQSRQEKPVNKNELPKFLGLPVGVALIVAIGISIGFCILIVDTSTLSTTVVGKYVMLEKHF